MCQPSWGRAAGDSKRVCITIITSSCNLHGVCQVLALDVAASASDLMRWESGRRSSLQPFVKQDWIRWRTQCRLRQCKDTLGQLSAFDVLHVAGAVMRAGKRCSRRQCLGQGRYLKVWPVTAAGAGAEAD